MTRSSNRLRLALAACGLATLAWTQVPAHADPTLPPEKDPLVQNMDHSVSPGTDFFKYACGKWIKENPIPPSERGWGIANLVNEETYRQRLAICRAAARTGTTKGSSAQKVGDFWATGMDSVTIDRQGVLPLKPYLSQIAGIHTRTDLLAVVAKFHTYGFHPLYSMFVGQDEKNSDRYIVHLYQGGLHMPDRDYYFGQDSTTKYVRSEYGKHLTALFKLLGDDSAKAEASSATVLRLETALAARSRTLEQRRDPWANYNKYSLAELQKLTPMIDWAGQFTAMGVPIQDTVVVGQPEFFKQLDSCLVHVAHLSEWQAYLRFVVVTSLAPNLARPVDQENFHFYGTVLSGTKTQRPRWKRMLDATEDAIGELVGQEWVKQYCSPATKARYEKLTEDIISVYRDRIRDLSWMSAETKQRALAKLDKVTRKVAYPDHWRDYSTLTLDRSSYVANQVRVDEWWFRHEAAKLGKPIDRTEWDMTPQTYNAYYDGSKVEIVLPAAAFMLPGVPDSLVDDAVLYSYAGGSTIGHEITHGFDDEGRQFDDKGNLNPWWTDSDSAQFATRAHKLVEQFNAYVVGDKHVRGQATLGENIADLGGVRLGYEAFKKTDQWKSGQKINGLTPDQRYFLGYALSWLGQRRPAALQAQIMSDVHAPAFLRVNGPLANIPEFYSAFGIKPGDPMYRADDVRVEIW
ncbi:MAG TPA: M13 family metallopeptidase [Candidatus Eisenbacteria bacterium]